jgi:dephospho-CoA kinase
VLKIRPVCQASATMIIIGLTGSIATGKSTVSKLLAGPPHNIPVIDADLLARQVVEPGTPGYKAIVSHFGPTTPDLLQEPVEGAGQSRNGRPLNRAVLGRRVFGTSPTRRADRAVLNGIVHPAVRKAMLRAVAAAYLIGHWAVVLDVPLLFESGLDVLCGSVIVVGVTDPKVQMARLRARDPHLGEAEARDRVSSQDDVRVKARRCELRPSGVVVWNDRGKDELKREVDRAVQSLSTSSPHWWNRVLWICPPLAAVVAAWTYWRNLEANRSWKRVELQEKAKL